MLKSEGPKGFTLIELMIVIAIMGILAAIALPNFISYRRRANNNNAVRDAKNSFTASQTYFNDYPSSSFSTVTPLYSYGFRQTDNVTVLVSGSQAALQIRTYHSSGDKTYTVNSDGAVN